MTRSFCFGAFGLYLCVCITVLALGFPNEDALILFKFANNVAHGDGIVYLHGGSPAEGASLRVLPVVALVTALVRPDGAI